MPLDELKVKLNQLIIDPEDIKKSKIINLSQQLDGYIVKEQRARLEKLDSKKAN